MQALRSLARRSSIGGALLPSSVAAVRQPQAASGARLLFGPATASAKCKQPSQLGSPFKFKHDSSVQAGQVGGRGGGGGWMARGMVTAAPAVDQHLVPIVNRLHLIEQKLDGSSMRSQQAVDACYVEVEKCRTMIEQLAKAEMATSEATKRALSSQMTLNGLFLVYLFTVCTWMLLLLTDLSGHMHGIPVVRMVSLKPHTSDKEKPLKEMRKRLDDLDISVEPESGLVDVNTDMEPHLTTSK